MSSTPILDDANRKLSADSEKLNEKKTDLNKQTLDLQRETAVEKKLETDLVNKKGEIKKIIDTITHTKLDISAAERTVAADARKVDEEKHKIEAALRQGEKDAHKSH